MIVTITANAIPATKNTKFILSSKRTPSAPPLPRPGYAKLIAGITNTSSNTTI
jgi:hypothetical protein